MSDQRDDADRSAQGGDGSQDVIAGGLARRSGRTALIIGVVAALLAAEPLWRQIAAQSSPARGHQAAPLDERPATSEPSSPSPRAASVGAPVTELLLRPHARGSDLALRRWYSSLPVAPTKKPRAPGVKAVFRVSHRPDFTGSRDFAGVAQVRGVSGWVDVAHGDISAGHVDASGRWVAFVVGVASLSEPKVRTWAYVVSLRSAVVVTALVIPRQALVSGWFGDQVVIDRSAIGLPPLLVDGAGRQAPLELHAGVSAIMAISPRGRWAVTRDLRWLDRSTGRSTQLTGRPFRWPVDNVDFIDDRRALVAVGISGRTLTVLCSQVDGCARVR